MRKRKCGLLIIWIVLGTRATGVPRVWDQRIASSTLKFNNFKKKQKNTRGGNNVWKNRTRG